MRVLMLTWEYPPNIMGGLGTHIAGLAPALVRAGIEVYVITPRPPGSSSSAHIPEDVNRPDQEVTEDGIVVYRVPWDESGDDVYNQARKVNQLMQAQASAILDSHGNHFDLIHAHDWLVVFAAQALKHQYRLPLIATIHATERGRCRGETLHTNLQRDIHGAEWWLAYEAWRVITCSHHMASEVQAFFRVPAEKVDVVPNGVSACQNGHWSQADLVTCRSRYGFLNRRLVFAVGRLVYEKGFHLLVEAAPRILSEFPDTRFVIAGRGPEAADLMQRARRLGVADYIHFPGFISDRERDCLYHAAACAVFPSLYEPFGIVALEAMAAGCPVVVTEVGGLREVVRHGRTGITVYPDDAQSVAWGVINTLRNPALAASRALEAQRVVRREFSWDAIAARTIAVYQRVHDERKRIDW
ncbi:MAG: glycosyltransferase family 4 protein [Anaerolineae bacterium]